MSRQYLIGIDLGSSFIKATLFDATGRAIAAGKQDNHPDQPGAGVAEYDGPKMLAAAWGAVRSLLEVADVPAGDVAAVGMDGMISGCIGIDEAGQPTTPYTTTLDMRFAPQWNDVLDRLHDPIRTACGSGQPTMGPKMMWVRDAFPDVYARTARFLTVTGYVAGAMIGATVDRTVIDHTHLWATGLADVQQRTWSVELCEAMGLDIRKLPRIAEPTDTVGGLCAGAAEATGLREGTPVVAGVADQSAGFIGAGLVRAGQVGSVAGTYPVLTLVTDEFRPDMDTRLTEILASAIPGLYHPSNFMIGGGLTHHWFAEQFADGSGDAAYAELDRLAEAVPPGSERLLLNPHLGGRACPTRTNYRGAWVGFTWSHRREHFYRALLESIAYDQTVALQSLRATYPEHDPDDVVIFGGAARSGLWNRIKADVLGLPHTALARDDLTALGSALIAGAGVGIYGDLTAAADSLERETSRFDPDPARHAFYKPYCDAYANLLKTLDAFYDHLADLPAWPGDA